MRTETATVDIHWRCIASSLGFTEGPLWTSDDRLLLVSTSRGLVYELDADSGATKSSLEAGGNPSGLAEDADARIWIAQGGARGTSHSHRKVAASIQRIDKSEVLDVAATGFSAPNDLVIGPDRRLWFTDPVGPAFEGTPRPGAIRVLDPATGTVSLAAEGAFFPNGLAFSPESSALFVAETFTARILRYPLINGELSQPEIFAALPLGRPDGLVFDRAGSLYVAGTTADAVFVYGPDAKLIEMLPLDEGAMPTNLCFGGKARQTLFVTAPKGGRLIATHRPIGGAKLPFEQ